MFNSVPQKTSSKETVVIIFPRFNGKDVSLIATQRNLEHPGVKVHEIKDLDHGTVSQGAAEVMPVFIQRISKAVDAAR